MNKQQDMHDCFHDQNDNDVSNIHKQAILSAVWHGIFYAPQRRGATRRFYAWGGAEMIL
ncbi:MAG: hypothetical protein KHX22_09010 [Clostridiales bacterium]|jgi:hypothetical protein|nr:hypothetical protein [Clostridiales bacterium]